MIGRHEMLRMLVEACPSFTGTLKDYRDFFEEEITYTELGAFANHLVELYKENKTDDFEKIFEIVERFHTEGDEYVKEAATIGLLEGLQNIAGNRDLDPEVFYPYLEPVSAIWWNDLNKFWNGETDFVGKTLNGKN